MGGALRSLTTASTGEDGSSDTLVWRMWRGGAHDATTAQVDGAGPRTLAGGMDEMAMVGVEGGR
jgi:hypothetical protein